MAEESDADRIWKDREVRRAAERARIAHERRDRQRELVRLGLLEADAVAEHGDLRDGSVPKVVIDRKGPNPAEEAGSGGSGDPIPTPLGHNPTREIGGSVMPPAVGQFLKTDPTERFDLELLNTLRFPGLVESAQSDATVLAAVVRRTAALMVRIKNEVDDPLSAGAILRDQVLRWFRDSPSDPAWTSKMTERWAGLFADSRVGGGRLQPWINVRLWTMREEAARAGPFRQKLKRGLTRDRGAEAALGRTAHQQILAEVAQALLDDLAARPRPADPSVPLVRLSELAVRRQVPTINDSLALLFNAPETGPFVLLHPNRYPDCEEVVLRPPVAGATGAALAYSLVMGRSARKPSGRTRGPGDDRTLEGEVRPDPLADEVDAASIWTAEEVGPDTWRRILEEHRRERRRLDSPPKDARSRPAYAALRTLLLLDGSVRKSFLSVKWRGRPTGLPLLVSLLQKSTLVPEVSTDHEYLEAELGELVQGDAQWHPEDGRWEFPGWVAVREGDHRQGFSFRADPRA